jgi:beta-lactamase regulating signal transducer with metallopeptidase domain/protocatechuate 3,4-dioxygenase beta subunit
MTQSLLVSSDWFVGQLVDVSLKSLLLAVVAGAAMWVLGSWWDSARSASVRHRVWTAVLVGMLVMPLLVPWTIAVPLPGWAYPELQAEATVEVPSAPVVAALPVEAVAAVEIPTNVPLVSIPAIPATADSEFASMPMEAAVVVTKPVAQSVGPWSWVVGCYLLGVALLGTRLLVGLVAARQLVRGARPVDGAKLPAAAGAATPVYESSRVRVPITVGWLRPAIVLPQDWSTWDAAMLDAVLAHERAHVRRGDLWVALAARVNAIVYWFHPLAWFLSRRLTALAESACDDAVIDSLGDRTGYARHLLSVAARLSGAPRRLEPVGVAMAARPMVEQRIEAILDDRRPLARRVGWVGTLLLVMAITPAILLAAGITAESANDEAVDVGALALEALKKNAEAEQGAKPQATLEASETGTLELLVVDEHDAPVPNADVRMRVRQVFMGGDTWTNLKTDAGGRLKFDVPTPTPYYLSAHVSTPGHAPFLAEWENHETPDPIPAVYTLRLDAARTIGGVVRDEDGKPIEGVKVRPQFNLALRPERTYPMGSGASATTNARGEWKYESLPADVQQVPLTFEHAGYVPAQATESISRLAIADGAAPTVATTMQRGLPIEGRVTDAEGKPIAGAVVTYGNATAYRSDSPTVETDVEGRYRITSGEAGEAILNAWSANLAPAMRVVRVERAMEAVDFQLTAGRELQLRVVGPDQAPVEGAYVSFRNWDSENVLGDFRGSRGKTDARGLWQWGDAPAGELEFAVSAKGFRYVSGERVTRGGRNTIVLAPETSTQARMLRFAGNVVDAEKGTPIAQFRVTPGWKRAAHERIFWNGESQTKGRDGKFRRDFAPNEVVDDADIIVLRVEAEGYAPQVVHTTLTEADSYTADFALEQAADESYEVLTPDGKPAAGAVVGIATTDLGPTIQDGTLADYSPCERATSGADGRVNISPQTGLFGLMVVHESGAAYAVPAPLAKSRTIQLQPWARVEGTLRMGGKPAADEQVTLDLQGPEWGMPRLNYDYKTKTDAKGAFVFERVVPGSGNVSRVSVTRMEGGMTRWTPTHTAKATFVPGETAHVALGQLGRSIIGRLKLAADVKPGNAWRHASVSLQSVATNLPERPKVPYPLGMDPEKDADAARVWWDDWSKTEAGKAWRAEFQKYADAFKAFKPAHYRADAAEDGSFRFEDLPAGRYRLNVRAHAARSEMPTLSGETLGTHNQEFEVAPVAEGGEIEPVDLGELVIEAEKKAAAQRQQPVEAVAKPQAKPEPKAKPEPQVESEAASAEAAAKPGVRGRVVLASDGSLVIGAEVRLVTWNEGRSRYDTQKTTSDDLGEFEFKHVPRGTNELVAYHGELASRKSMYQGEPVEVAADGKSYPLSTLKLAPTPRIVARVVSVADGKPVADAVVHPVWSDGERDQRTDANGEATLRRLTNEVWHIEVKAKGFAQQVQAINLANTETARVTFELAPGAALEGTVRDEAGKPVAGAEISVFPADFNGEQIEYLKTDGAGKYRFDYLPVTKGLMLMLSRDGYADMREAVTLEAGAAAARSLDLVLKQRPHGGTVRGVVTDKDGKPIAGAAVRNDGRSSRDFRTATTDANGKFTVDNVFEGSVGYEVILKAQDFAPQRVAFKPGTREEPGEVAVALAPGHRVRGRVVDAAGKPIAGVRIASSDGNRGGGFNFGQTGTTDAAGRFAFDSLPTDAPFDFSKMGYSELEDQQLALDGAEEVVVTLESAAVIRGRVVDAATGEPVPVFNVAITFSPDRKQGDPRSHLSGARATSPEGESFAPADGLFVLEDLVRGMPLQVTVSAERYAKKTLRRVVAEPQETAELFAFDLTPVRQDELFQLKGRIMDSESRPVAAAELRLVVASKRSFPRDAFPFNWSMLKSGQVANQDGVEQFLSTTSDAAGNFVFRDVQPGKDIELAYWGDGISQGRVEHLEKLTAEERGAVTIAGVTPGAVHVLIDRKVLSKITSVMLMLQEGGTTKRASDYFSESVSTNETEYEFRNLPPGGYRLNVHGERTRVSAASEMFTDKVMRHYDLEVVSGKTVTVEIDGEPTYSLPTLPKVDPSAAIIKPVVPPTDESTPRSESTEDGVEVRGRVVDEAARPVAGARLWLPVRYDAATNDYLTIEATSDERGMYTLSVDTKLIASRTSAPVWTIWCYAPGKCIATAGAYQQLQGKTTEPISIRLAPESDTAFTVLDAGGKPVSGARVEPWHFLAGSYEIVPRALREIIGGQSNLEGIVKMSAMPREGFSSVQVTAEDYGTQQQPLRDAANEPAMRTIQLRATGRIEGRLAADEEKFVANVPIHVYQEEFRGEYSSGTAMVTTDEAGKFVVEHFAEGPIRLIISSDDKLPVRPQVPEKLEVFAGETTEILIPMVAGVSVEGIVRTKVGHRPVAGALVSVQYGSVMQRDQMRTDELGRFRATVLPGQVRQDLIMRPDSFKHWVTEKVGWEAPIEIAAGTSAINLPPIELVETFERRGRLIDEAGQPVAKGRLSAVVGNRNLAMAMTDERGEFGIWLPKLPAVDSYNADISRDDPRYEVNVVSEEPLVLQLAR